MSRTSSGTILGALAALGLAVHPSALQEGAPAAAEPDLPVLRSGRGVLSIQEGATLRRDAWRLDPEVRPDVYEVAVPDDGPATVAFVSDVDRISFTVEVESQHDFVVLHGEDRCYTRVVGVHVPPAAVFDADYRATHAGRILVEVPEVYELVNVALALTATGIRDRNLVYHDSDYYRTMREWFEPFRDHPVVQALDEALAHGPGYNRLKMNGYAFVFDADGRIVRSPVYDRTSFRGERSNSLLPFLPGLQALADDSSFRDFYAENRATYAEQIEFYEKTADLPGMRAWLDREFPRSSGYDCCKVVFSPLVAYNQSSTWLESNGFRELQAHVNFPYPQDVQGFVARGLSAATVVVAREDIVFTELNHGYINPEADLHAERIADAISRRELWVDPSQGSDYYAGIAAFNEYMNWALVNLRVADIVPAGEQEALFESVERMMTGSRGFHRFAAFDRFLLDLVRERRPGETVADLYPRIIAWFERENARED